MERLQYEELIKDFEVFESEKDLMIYLTNIVKPSIQIGKKDALKNNYKTYKWVECDIESFNEVLREIHKYDLNKTILTKSGNYSNLNRYRPNNLRSYNVKVTSRGINLSVYISFYVWSFSIAHRDKNSEGIPPRVAFNLFHKLCDNFGIDLDKYVIDNGKEVKETIEKPMICMQQYMSVNDEPLTHCHHIDFHNSYPAGLVNTHPEFRGVVNYLYEGRKTNPKNKAILNYTIGCMQSTKFPYMSRWAHLSKDAIEDNNKRVRSIATKLVLSGRRILGFNTDGIWYQGEIYHGEGEGDKLGEWSNDHTNCLFRSKSDGAYEFIENGKYYPVVRGYTNLDNIKDREEWEWGDIYISGEPIQIEFDEKLEQIITIKENNDEV